MKLEAFGNRPTRYPQINAAYEEIRRRYNWDRKLYHDAQLLDSIASEKRATRRAAYLFPWNSAEPGDCEDLDCSAPKEADVGLEEIVSTVASAIQRWSLQPCAKTRLFFFLTTRLPQIGNHAKRTPSPITPPS